MEKSGQLPKRVQIGTRSVGWRTSDIEEWLEQLQPSDFRREALK
jgi:predicted DNA-binding transcriptional regulator AlpA